MLLYPNIFFKLDPNGISQFPFVWVLVFGPMALLPVALLEWCRPRWGAATLMAASVLAGESAIRAGKWEGGYDEWTAFLGLTAVTVPLMTLGLALFVTAKRQFSLRTLVALITFVAVSSGYFFFRYENMTTRIEKQTVPAKKYGTEVSSPKQTLPDNLARQ
jgi:hypothetical protein